MDVLWECRWLLRTGRAHRRRTTSCLSTFCIPISAINISKSNGISEPRSAIGRWFSPQTRRTSRRSRSNRADVHVTTLVVLHQTGPRPLWAERRDDVQRWRQGRWWSHSGNLVEQPSDDIELRGEVEDDEGHSTGRRANCLVRRPSRTLDWRPSTRFLQHTRLVQAACDIFLTCHYSICLVSFKQRRSLIEFKLDQSNLNLKKRIQK